MRRFILSLFLLPFLSATLTETHLKQISLHQIHEDLKLSYLHEEWKVKKFEASYPLFLEIIANENKPGFFGYHGHTQQFRIFQDILRVVHEEVLGETIPPNFYFLRIPGDPLYDLEEGTKSYYDLFDPQAKTKQQEKMAVELFILKPLNQKSPLNLEVEAFTEEEISVLFEPIVLHVQESLKDAEIKGLFSLDKNFEKKFAQKFKNDPRGDYKKKITTSFLKIQKGFYGGGEKNPSFKKLSQLISSKTGQTEKKLLGLIKECLNEQTINQKFLDIILNAPPEQSNFLMSLFFPYWDTRPEQQSRVISINYSLFGNYNFIGESTLDVYLNDRSIEAGESKVITLLEDYFEKLGMDPSLVRPLVLSLNKKIASYKVEGCLLQFFDESPGYTFLNKCSYVAKPFGIPVKNVPPSEIALEKIPFMKKGGDFFQLRLLMANRYTLTPNGSIRMIRYDRLPPEIGEEILQEIRNQILKDPNAIHSALFLPPFFQFGCSPLRLTV